MATTNTNNLRVHFNLRGETCLFMTDGEQQKQTQPEHDEANRKAVKHQSLNTPVQHVQLSTII